MKILLLNHNIDTQHGIVRRLQSAGAVVLLASSVDEAWKMIQFHSASLDLAVIHREGRDYAAEDEGNQLISRIKAEPAQADLPIVLTSNLWNEAEFFEHQKSPLGVNAYLRWPVTEKELVSTIETMFGGPISAGNGTQSVIRLNAEVAAPPSEVANLSIVLEEQDHDVSGSFRSLDSSNQIHLDAPDMPESEGAVQLESVPSHFRGRHQVGIVVGAGSDRGRRKLQKAGVDS